MPLELGFVLPLSPRCQVHGRILLGTKYRGKGKVSLPLGVMLKSRRDLDQSNHPGTRAAQAGGWGWDLITLIGHPRGM